MRHLAALGFEVVRRDGVGAVHVRAPAAIPAIHALWTLHGLGLLD